MRLLVVGSGHVARALSAAWRATHDVEQRPARAPWPAQRSYDAVFVAVADRAIAAVASEVVSAGAADSSTVLLHAAGALAPEEVFAALRSRVGGVALCHPLLAVADDDPARFRGAVFAIAGDARGLDVARALALDAGGKPIVLDGAGLVRYHAAAALTANHTLALVAAGVALLEGEGIARRDAEVALGRLLGSAADNVARLGLPAALTGAIARGDVAVVARHLGALPLEARALYRATGPATVALARARGGDPAALDRIAALFLDETTRADD